MNIELSRDERNRLVKLRSEALAQHEAAMTLVGLYPPYSKAESEALADAREAMGRARNAEEEYFERLPAVVMGHCPFDGRPLLRTYDPFGLDGPWWRPEANPTEPPACPHFCVVTGALDKHALTSASSEWTTYPGPTMPYVIPRLLDMPGMVASVTAIPDAFVVAYFAERKPKIELLTAPWPRTNFSYTTQMSIDSWRIPNEVWDFDLAPWIAKGKLTASIPLEIRGSRDRVGVCGRVIQSFGIPDGTQIWPMPH
jgi:hypothetical protein